MREMMSRLSKLENVIFSLRCTDDHTLRLSSVWPINFQYHNQAAATGYSCVP